MVSSCLQQIQSLPKKWGGFNPERSEGSAFRTNAKEKADSSGKKNRARNNNSRVFPQTVQPL